MPYQPPLITDGDAGFVIAAITESGALRTDVWTTAVYSQYEAATREFGEADQHTQYEGVRVFQLIDVTPRTADITLDQAEADALEAVEQGHVDSRQVRAHHTLIARNLLAFEDGELVLTMKGNRALADRDNGGPTRTYGRQCRHCGTPVRVVDGQALDGYDRDGCSVNPGRQHEAREVTPPPPPPA